MTGFKRMIMDRVPLAWSVGLKYCRYKQKWIDYVYDTHVRPINTDYRVAERTRRKSERVRFICGETKDAFGNRMKFGQTINTDRMLLNDKEKYDNWMWVIRWVEWVVNNAHYIYAGYTHKLLINHMSPDVAIAQLASEYKVEERLIKLIVTDYASKHGS